MEILRQDDKIIPEWRFKKEQTPIYKKLNNPKTIKQIARGKINIDDKELEKRLAEKMINPYFLWRNYENRLQN